MEPLPANVQAALDNLLTPYIARLDTVRAQAERTDTELGILKLALSSLARELEAEKEKLKKAVAKQGGKAGRLTLSGYSNIKEAAVLIASAAAQRCRQDWRTNAETYGATAADFTDELEPVGVKRKAAGAAAGAAGDETGDMEAHEGGVETGEAEME